jgi:hypothetical protein
MITLLTMMKKDIDHDSLEQERRDINHDVLEQETKTLMKEIDIMNITETEKTMTIIKSNIEKLKQSKKFDSNIQNMYNRILKTQEIFATIIEQIQEVNKKNHLLEEQKIMTLEEIIKLEKTIKLQEITTIIEQASSTIDNVIHIIENPVKYSIIEAQLRNIEMIDMKNYTLDNLYYMLKNIKNIKSMKCMYEQTLYIEEKITSLTNDNMESILSKFVMNIKTANNQNLKNITKYNTINDKDIEKYKAPIKQIQKINDIIKLVKIKINRIHTSVEDKILTLINIPDLKNEDTANISRRALIEYKIKLQTAEQITRITQQIIIDTEIINKHNALKSKHKEAIERLEQFLHESLQQQDKIKEETTDKITQLRNMISTNQKQKETSKEINKIKSQISETQLILKNTLRILEPITRKSSDEIIINNIYGYNGIRLQNKTNYDAIREIEMKIKSMRAHKEIQNIIDDINGQSIIIKTTKDNIEQLINNKTESKINLDDIERQIEQITSSLAVINELLTINKISQDSTEEVNMRYLEIFKAHKDNKIQYEDLKKINIPLSKS